MYLTHMKTKLMSVTLNNIFIPSIMCKSYELVHNTHVKVRLKLAMNTDLLIIYKQCRV